MIDSTAVNGYKGVLIIDNSCVTMDDRGMDVEKLTITGYSHEGAGVARLKGQVVFVPGALAGEEVLVEITGQHKSVLTARLIKILTRHEQRMVPRCDVYKTCGGCSLQHMSYEAQLEMKRETVRNALQRIGGFPGVSVLPVLGMKEPWGYRNKGHFRVGRQVGKVVLGFYEEGTRELVGQSCRHLFSPAVTALLEYLEHLLFASGIDIAGSEGQGLHHVLVRESRSTGEILLVFVVAGGSSPGMSDIARKIMDHYPAVAGVLLNRNDRIKGPLLGPVTDVLLGKGSIEDRLGPFIFSISPASFFQVNNRQAEVLYEKALEYAGLRGEETVVDAYCGIGTISLYLARQAARVIGIEVVPEAVVDAEKNRKRNHMLNVEFFQGEAEIILPQMVKQGLQPNAVVVDPPRKGCGEPLLNAIIQAAPQQVVYVSCNPATLARDLRHLAAGGYEMREVQPVDMFPHTYHVEAIILLQRQKP